MGFHAWESIQGNDVTMKKSFILDSGTFPDQTLFCFGGYSKRQVRAQLKKIGCSARFLRRFDLNFDEKGCRGQYYSDSQGGSVIWIESGRLDSETLSTIVHELHHAVYRSLGTRRGMQDEPEAQAYLIEYLFLQVLNKLKRK